MSRLQSFLAALCLAMSPSVALAGGFKLEEHGYYIIDFLILFGVLYFFVRKPAREFLEKRHDAVAEEIKEASSLKKSAEERLGKYTKMLGDLDGEAKRLREEFVADGHRESARIAKEGASAAAKLAADAEVRLGQQGRMLTKEIEGEVALRAVELAEQKVQAKLTPAVQRALVDSYIADLEKLERLEAAV